jgi:hypothetical protein
MVAAARTSLSSGRLIAVAGLETRDSRAYLMTDNPSSNERPERPRNANQVVRSGFGDGRTLNFPKTMTGF